MNKTKLHFTLIILLVLGAALVFPGAAFASGTGETFRAEVNGYHVTLNFVNEIKAGENEVHFQIVDSQDQFVTPTEVEISLMPMEEKGHEAAEGGHGSEPVAEHSADGHPPSAHAEPASGHENMPGMSTESEPVAESGHDLETGAHEEFVRVTLKPEIDSGEYKGILNFERSGDWNLVVHFVIGGELLEVEFPVNVAGTLSRSGVLAGIFGLNLAIVSTAAVLKRNAGKKSL